MIREMLMPSPRLVASGGPVTHAIAACRPKTIEEERAELRALADSIYERLQADFELFKRVEAAYAIAPVMAELA